MLRKKELYFKLNFFRFLTWLKTQPDVLRTLKYDCTRFTIFVIKLQTKFPKIGEMSVSVKKANSPLYSEVIGRSITNNNGLLVISNLHVIMLITL